MLRPKLYLANRIMEEALRAIPFGLLGVAGVYLLIVVVGLLLFWRL